MAFSPNRLLKNVMSAGKARQNSAKKRSLWLINEHFEPNFNAVSPSEIVFQQPAKAVLTTLFPCNAPPETAASVFKAICRRWGSRHFITGLLTAAASIGPGKNTPGAVIVAHSMTHAKKVATQGMSIN